MIETLERYWSITIALLPFLWQGFLQTLVISFVSIIAGSLIGFVIGVIRSQRVPVQTPLLGL